MKNLKVYPLLLQAFEESRGCIREEKIDELVKKAEGEYTKRQIKQWFTRRRHKLGMSHDFKKAIRFSKRQRAILERAFVANGAFISGEKLEEFVASTNDQFTKKQVENWFYRKRVKLKMTDRENSYRKVSYLNRVT